MCVHPIHRHSVDIAPIVLHWFGCIVTWGGGWEREGRRRRRGGGGEGVCMDTSEM